MSKGTVPKAGDVRLMGLLAAEISRLRAALAPFAMAADDLDDEADDKHEIWEMAAAMGITAGHLRAAAKALRPNPTPASQSKAPSLRRRG